MRQATMTIQDACRYSGLSRSTLYNLIREQSLSSRTVGRRRLIVRESLDELLGLTAEKEAA